MNLETARRYVLAVSHHDFCNFGDATHLKQQRGCLPLFLRKRTERNVCLPEAPSGHSAYTHIPWRSYFSQWQLPQMTGDWPRVAGRTNWSPIHRRCSFLQRPKEPSFNNGRNSHWWMAAFWNFNVAVSCVKVKDEKEEEEAISVWKIKVKSQWLLVLLSDI